MAYVLVAAIVGGGIAFLVFLRQLHRTLSRRGREQLDSLGPLLGPTHPLWPTKEMRAFHRDHRIVPVSVRPHAVNGPSHGSRAEEDWGTDGGGGEAGHKPILSSQS